MVSIHQESFEEIVPDSEPERAEQRRRDNDQTQKAMTREKAERRCKQDAATRQTKRVESLQDKNVIDLTVSPASSSTSSIGDGHHKSTVLDTVQSNKLSLPNGQIDHTIDISDSSPSMDLVSLPQENDSTHSSSGMRSTEGMTFNCPVPPVLVPASQEDGDMPRLRLDRFAYKEQPRRLSVQPIRSNSPSLGNTVPQLSKKLIRTGSHRFLENFSDAQIFELSKCVSCDTRWSTRKGREAKMLHIRSCSKKKGWTDETVKLLIIQELESVQAGKEAVLEARAASKSLLQAVFDDSSSRKGKRTKVVKTVKQPSEIRPEILQRARSLLSRGTLELVHPEVDQVLSPPATQVFGPSRLLAQCNDSASEASATTSHTLSAPNMLFPPATQAFGSSSFSLRRNSNKEGSVDDPPSIYRISTSSTSQEVENHPLHLAHPLARPSSSNSLYAESSLSEDYQNLRSTSNQPSSAPVNYDHGGLDWGRDDAILHFDPTLKYAIQEEFLFHEQEHGPSGSITLTRSKSPGSSRIPSPVLPNAEPEEHADLSLELNTLLLQMIRENTEMHLRILRYEPIPFDEFIQMASNIGIPLLRSKRALREFLDKQGINFHGAYAKGSRTRKRRL